MEKHEKKFAIALGSAATAALLFMGSPLCGKLVSAAMPYAGAETYYVTAEGGLNARFLPSRKSSVEALLEKGEAVEVLYIEDGWAACQIGVDVYYCSVDYLSAEEPAEGSTAATIKSNGRVALREGPGSDYSRVGWLQNGDKVAVSGSVNGWKRVTGGYVLAEYVEEAEQ